MRLAFTTLPVGGRQRSVAVGLAVAAVAVGAGLTLAQLAAAWTPVPDALEGGELRGAVDNCLKQLGSLPNSPPPVTGSTQLGEARGSSQAVLIAGESRTAVCVGSDSDRVSGVFDVGSGSGGPDRLGVVVDGTPGRLNGTGAIRAVYGRFGAGVVAVRISTADGRDVSASEGGGEFLAWWPSGANPVTVRGFDATGREVASVRPERSGPVPSQSVRSPTP